MVGGLVGVGANVGGGLVGTGADVGANVTGALLGAKLVVPEPLPDVVRVIFFDFDFFEESFAVVGTEVGGLVRVGAAVGGFVGEVGELDGRDEGALLGTDDGALVGSDGALLGREDGSFVGRKDGDFVGEEVGALVGGSGLDVW